MLALLLIAAFALLLFGRKSRHFAWSMTAVCVILSLWSWPPSAVLLSGALEWWYPVRPYPPGEAEALVVPGGAVYSHDASEPEDLAATSTYLRTQYAAWLHQNWRKLPIVVAGGSADAKRVSISEVMARILEQRGIPPSMIWRENQSHTTHENALYSAALLRTKGIRRIVLVTEAYHMLRAEAAFRKQGLTVVPAPCCYRTLKSLASWRAFLPDPHAMSENEEALHESLGLLWYAVSGKI